MVESVKSPFALVTSDFWTEIQLKIPLRKFSAYLQSRSPSEHFDSSAKRYQYTFSGAKSLRLVPGKERIR
jgi:hypothetical protein